MRTVHPRGRVPLARRNLLAEPRRLVAGVAGIGLALMLILLLGGLWAGIQDQSTQYVDASGAALWVLPPGTRTLFAEGTELDDRGSRIVILPALVVLLTCTDHVGSCHRETVQCVRDAALMDLEDEGFLVRRALPVSTKQAWSVHRAAPSALSHMRLPPGARRTDEIQNRQPRRLDGWRASAGTSNPAPRGLPDRATPVRVCVLTTVRLSEEAALPEKYEGVHAFLFLYQEDEIPPAAVVENLRPSINRDAGPVFFVGTFEGDFQGFAHIAHDDTQAVGDLIAGPLWEAGVRSHYVTEAKYHKNQQGQAMGPTRYSPRFLAIARVYVSQPPTQVMENVARSFGDRLDQYGESLSAFIGASTVIGGFHLLVELGDDDRQGLDRHVESLRAVDGVGRVEVAVTDTGPTQAA